MKSKVKLPIMHQEIRFLPKTANDENRTIDIIFSTGARVKRRGWLGDVWHEELSLKRSHIKLDRLNAGAPFLDMHDIGASGFFSQGRGIRAQLGVIEKARLEKDENAEQGKVAVATVRFSKRAEVDDIWNDVKDGVIRNVSVGYMINRIEEQKERIGDNEDEIVYRVTDWEPHEISLVTIPADSGAQVRYGENMLSNNCEVIRLNEGKDESMPPEEKKTPGNGAQGDNTQQRTEPAQQPAQTQPRVDLDKVQGDAITQERKRCEEINDSVKKAGFERDVADDMIKRGISVADAHKEIIERMGKKSEDTETMSGNIALTHDEREHEVRAVRNAMLHRYDSKKYELDEQSKVYRHFTLLDIARDCVERNGHSTRGLSPLELTKRAFHSTSDFPLILEDLTNKSLRDAYQLAPRTFEQFVRRVEVSDFKQISRVQLGEGESLEKVPESGEIKQGTVSENAEKYFVETYAKMMTFTRKMIINDDLDAFTRIPAMLGVRAADLESKLIWEDIIIANPLMADGNALFSAPHGNLSPGGAAVISIASLGKARAAMRTQTGLDGLKLNISPRYLYVPAALETVADQFVSDITPDQAGNVNPFRGRLSVGAESRLDDASAISWYVMADMGQLDMIELATISGEGGPVTETQDTFEVEGMKIKIRVDLGAKAIDYRGFVKNAGA